MNSLFIAFFIALIATFGSLFFSEIMNFIPCSLCWYQRIFMYPLLFILAISLLYKDSKVILNASPLAFVGFLISIYHNLLVYKIIPEDLSPCIGGVPCSVDYLNILGFITIPLLSLLAFFIILICLMLHYLSLVKVSKNLRENHAE
ncbi:Disulfide bond formation protein C [Aliarcobacter thereius]|uniref:Disulfide bond formation protein B n=2 Tax=Aliarcobacter thereius TaxID=544718 RepID=A0A1C0B7C5_9BACT|nr:disulfide oxidoreductase [Aliarcobacter thereius]OCL86817.1 Disulfide bond formation protein C [Aliarcobacter thereius]OCL91019.1 Disulfide bond formation protein C [Aliarcobacter thereius]OCL96151.1 Disulfide bond formation protein C [Aliarcobacter thereius LMG 24486]OCL99484.1 Disulfide bond formation protein C [Aliarcobacter thereius]QBF15881.1 protein-disulfide oxidoreductase [Aliarcobacter thereius LMG 24486]